MPSPRISLPGHSLRASAALLLALVAIHPTLAPGQGPRVERDVDYGGSGDAGQMLDMYLPQGTGFPTIVFFHEGSLVSGDKAQEPYKQMCANFVANGVGCIAANYRLGPVNRWPTQIIDAASAVAWTFKHIAQRGGDTAGVFLLGHSSGCQIVSLLGTDGKYLAAHHLAPTSVHGVIAMGCLLGPILDTAGMPTERVTRYFAPGGPLNIFGDIGALTDATPSSHVTRAMPPFLVLIADSEQVAPPVLAHATEFVAKAKAAGVDPLPLIRVLPNRRHMTAMTSMASSTDPTLALIVQFVKQGRH